MLNGILNINKPYGITSHDVVNKIRRILKIKKVGHTGTLDPAATGVLPICIGKHTKIIQYLPTDKEYIAEITLGITTDSYDSDGNITSKQAIKFNESDIIETLKGFKGEIIQEVPNFSATRYKGKKLYEYAHKGITIEDLPTKKVTIYNIELLETTNTSKENPIIKIKIECSSGTYIRSIANDLGKNLGYGAYMSKLVRTMSANLYLKDSKSFEEIENAFNSNSIDSMLLSPNNIIILQKQIIENNDIKKISLGQHIHNDKYNYNDKEKIILINSNNELLAIGEFSKEEQIIKPKTVFI